MEDARILSIVARCDEAKITICDAPDRPGIAYAILAPLAEANISIDLIVQNVGHDGLTNLSFTLNRGDCSKAMRILNEQVGQHIACREIICERRMGRVSVTGLGMRSHTEIAAKIFSTLGGHNINVEMISTSEISITVVVDENHAGSAAASLQEAFGLQN